MRLRTTLILILFPLVTMIGAGSVSAWFVFYLGNRALNGVTQPTVRENNQYIENQGGLTNLKIVDETKIIEKSVSYMDTYRVTTGEPQKGEE